MRFLHHSTHRRQQLHLLAWEMKRAPTFSEAKLWRELSGKKLGTAFRRQAVVGERYIADFLAPSVKLIVEVDGGYHVQRVRADARRDRNLQACGYRIVRVDAGDVVHRLPMVIARIVQALNSAPGT